MTTDHDGPATVHTGRPALDLDAIRARSRMALEDPPIHPYDRNSARLRSAGDVPDLLAEVERLTGDRPDDDGPDESLAMAIADVDQLTAQVAQVTRERDEARQQMADWQRQTEHALARREDAEREREAAQREMARLRSTLPAIDAEIVDEIRAALGTRVGQRVTEHARAVVRERDAERDRADQLARKLKVQASNYAHDRDEARRDLDTARQAINGYQTQLATARTQLGDDLAWDAKADYQRIRAELHQADQERDAALSGSPFRSTGTAVAEVKRLRREVERLKCARIVSAVFGHHPGAPKPFALWVNDGPRALVALGAEFPDGAVALRLANDGGWTTKSDGGAAQFAQANTEVVWLSDEFEPLAAQERREEALRAGIEALHAHARQERAGWDADAQHPNSVPAAVLTDIIDRLSFLLDGPTPAPNTTQPLHCAERPPRPGWNMPSRPRQDRGVDGIARTLWEVAP